MVNKRVCLLFLWVMFASPVLVRAQAGGNSSFAMLAYQPNSRIAALGGTAIATYERDINLAIQNPGLLRPEMSGQLGFSHVFHMADIGAGSLVYGYTRDSSQTIAGTLQYVSYGSFKKTASNGEDLGTFTAGEYALGMMYSKRLDPKVHIGGQVKFLYSSLEEYSSLGLALDMGITWHNPENLWTFSAVVSNLGKQLKTYTDQNAEDLPFNIQVGASKKLKNAPFRFTAVAQHLEKPGQLLYQNLNKPSLQKDLSSGEVIPENLSFGAKAMSHVVIGSELLLGRLLYGAFSYNYLRRWEMSLKDISGAAGFSWGFGVRMSRFQFGYARAVFVTGSSSDHISFLLNFGKK